jgi:hypothetical protein
MDKPTAPSFVAYWTNNGQSSALARDASVATIEFFWSK